MADDRIKLVAKLPKGELDGFASGLLADDLCTAVTEHRQPRPLAAILILDVKKVEVDPESGDRTAHLQIRRAQPVLGVAGRKAVEEVLFEEYSTEHGPVLPFEVSQITKLAFADLPRDPSEVDAMEERERDAMTPLDELRRHLGRVHGREDAHLMTKEEAEHRHSADHDGDLPAELAHEADWHGWTRSDIEAAEAEADGQVDFSNPTWPDPAVEPNVLDGETLDLGDGDTYRSSEHVMQGELDAEESRGTA